MADLDNLSAIARTAGSALKAQGERLRVISENIANADTIGTPGDNTYRRKVVTFGEIVDRETGAHMVAITSVSKDPAPLRLQYEPSHPLSNEEGYIERPNIEPLVEMANMREAARSYEANLNMIATGREMRRLTLDMLDK